MATKHRALLTLARRVFDIELAGLRAVRARLDDNFIHAVLALEETYVRRGKLVVVGIGKSGNIGRKIAATFNSTGATAVLLDALDAMHGDIGLLDYGDAVLALSYSGESEELLALITALKQFSVRIIAFTGAPRSSLARLSDIVVDARVPREACPFNLAPTASTTAMLALGDALAMALLHRRGFKEKDFARYHPSGSIGRSLSLRAGDLMRRGNRVAIVPQSLGVQEALLQMTSAKSGSVCVVDRNGRLAGVFTDGDLRRQMAHGEDVLRLPLAKVMTRHPITVREDALALEVLKIFREHKIDDLIVLNARRQPVGLIDSQDLPKLKLT